MRRAADDEQPRHGRIKPPSDQIVDERLHHSAFSVAPSISASDSLMPSSSIPIAATRTGSWPMWMAVDLHQQNVEPG
jgi:hypothetical protein